LQLTVRVWQVGQLIALTYHHAQAAAFVLGFNLIIYNSRSKSFGGVTYLHNENPLSISPYLLYPLLVAVTIYYSSISNYNKIYQNWLEIMN
jgi:uncharacterized membrane protein (DUF4010 family)